MVLRGVLALLRIPHAQDASPRKSQPAPNPQGCPRPASKTRLHPSGPSASFASFKQSGSGFVALGAGNTQSSLTVLLSPHVPSLGDATGLRVSLRVFLLSGETAFYSQSPEVPVSHRDPATRFSAPFPSSSLDTESRKDGPNHAKRAPQLFRGPSWGNGSRSRPGRGPLLQRHNGQTEFKREASDFSYKIQRTDLSNPIFSHFFSSLASRLLQRIYKTLRQE